MEDLSVEKIIDILSRKTIDGKAVEQTLLHASARNFNTLYDIQKNLVGVKRFDIPIQEMDRAYKLATDRESQHYPHRYIYRVPNTLISSGSRKLCKKHGLYGIPLSQEFISERTDVFDFNFFIFIEGHFIDTGEIIVKDGETIFILDVSAGEDTLLTDGIPMEDYNGYYARNSIVTLMILPNYTMSVANFNIYTFQDVMKRVVRCSRFTGNCNFSEKNTIFFMNTIDSHVSTKSLIPVHYDEENQWIEIPENVNVESVKLGISAITLPNIYSEISVPTGVSWIQLDRLEYPMPVPVENMITFVEYWDGTQTLTNDVEITLFYPNIYRIDSTSVTGKDIKIMVLYDKSDTTAYYNELSLLDLFSANLLERYENDELPDFVKDYKPMDCQWLTSGEAYTSSIYYPNRSLYNINAMAQLALRNPHYLIEYLYCKLKSAPKYYINVSKLPSLENRIRYDSSQECKESGEVVYFEEPCYIISLRKRFVGSFGLDFRIFIDNRFVSPKDYTLITAMDFYHFYIPVSLVQPDSVIEIEKYVEYENSRKITFDDVNVPMEITLPKHMRKIYAKNVMLVDDESRLFLQPRMYRIDAFNDIVNSEIMLDNRGYAKIQDSFKVTLLDEDYIGKPITLKVYHRLVTKTKRVDEFDPYEVPASVKFENNSDLDTSRIRVFTNGRMLPEKMYGLATDGHYMGDTKVQLYADVVLDAERYDPLTIDVLPVGQRCEFYQKSIENEYGFVDTGESLSLPLDLKWYDIYVNGLRLNKTNVDIITSNKFFIKGIDTRKNLYIYARYDIYDEFDILHEEAPDNKLFGQIEDIYKELLKDRDTLGDDMDDITEGMLEKIANHIKFVTEILEYSFINANEQQVTPEIRMLFPELIDEYGILWLDSNTYPDARCVTMINSNIRSEIMKNDQYRYGWVPLHIGSHEDARDGEYLCDPITGAPGMKNGDGSVIPTGELDRLTVHKTNLLTSMMNHGLSSHDIYQIQFNENTSARDITDGGDILDEPVDLSGTYIGKMLLSLDIQVLKRGYMDVMTYSGDIPLISIGYSQGGEDKSVIVPYNELSNYPIEVNASDVIIKHICLVPSDESSVKCILHSILLVI